jgi:PilZ domain
MPERRQSPRTPVRVPVKLRQKDGGRKGSPEQSAITRDLSSSGVFLYSEAVLEPGTRLELVLMLPPGIGVAPGWTLCEASVVRVEHSNGKPVGIAATLDRIELLPQLS